MSDDRAMARLPNWGVVTFLDILGWKGIYNRHEEPLSTLKGLIDYITQAEVQTRGLLPLGSKIVIKSISDTVVILNRCPRDNAIGSIRAHGILCCAAIPYSIERGIPVRGATAAGEYEHSENAFVGKAIDEAAAWHEASDWIGVNLTPSADFIYSDENQANWVQYALPSKGGLKWVPHCVNWPFFTKQGIDRESLCRSFIDLGPIIPEITGKLTNTLAFFDEQIHKHQGQEREQETPTQMNTEGPNKTTEAVVHPGSPILRTDVTQYLTSHPAYRHYLELLQRMRGKLGAVEVQLTAGNCIVHIAADKPKRPNRFIEMTKTADHLEFRLRHDGSYHDPEGWLQLKDWQGASLPPLRRYFYFTKDSDLDYVLRLISASYRSIMPRE